MGSLLSCRNCGILWARWEDEDDSGDEDEPNGGTRQPLEESRQENRQADDVGALKNGPLELSVPLSEEDDDEVYAIEAAKKEAAERERRRYMSPCNTASTSCHSLYFFVFFIFLLLTTVSIVGSKMGT